MTAGNLFTQSGDGALQYMTARNISATHAFTTRLGGVSGGVFSSLNLRARDGENPENVRANFEIICRALGVSPECLVFSNQVHGASARVVSLDDRTVPTGRPTGDADAMATSARGLSLVVFTADCAPILLHDPLVGAIGAVHAGWRSTAGDVAGAAVSLMSRELGCRPSDIRAAIGPCISSCCFETGSDVAEAMFALFPGSAERDATVRRRGDKFLVDLKAANALLLERAGLLRENIAISDECTCCLGDKYWSHRATGGVRGSQAAIISL
jgi:YfiH family protein